MLTNQEPDRNIEDLTDTEIYNLIRYLEPNPQCANEVDGDGDRLALERTEISQVKCQIERRCLNKLTPAHI